MSFDFSFIAGGGAAAILTAVAVLVKNVISSRNESHSVESGSVKDAATTNALLLNTNKAVYEHNTRLQEHIMQKDQEIRELKQKLNEALVICDSLQKENDKQRVIIDKLKSDIHKILDKQDQKDAPATGE